MLRYEQMADRSRDAHAFGERVSVAPTGAVGVARIAAGWRRFRALQEQVRLAEQPFDSVRQQMLCHSFTSATASRV